jgi:hypothetical protein
MKDKIYIGIITVLLLLVAIFYIQKEHGKSKLFKTEQNLRVTKIRHDSIVKIADGQYQKLVADTLTKVQLKNLAYKYIALKKREPVSVTTIEAGPKSLQKRTDKVEIKEDSLFIEDYYPDKLKPFLKYTNNISLKTKLGNSNFKFSTIKITQVVTKKENGLYQIDFIAPDFLDVKSIDVQSEPMAKEKKDNWGTLIGVDYGKNLESQRNIFGINIYKRYKKFYIGASIDSDKIVRGGIKIEL